MSRGSSGLPIRPESKRYATLLGLPIRSATRSCSFVSVREAFRRAGSPPDRVSFPLVSSVLRRLQREVGNRILVRVRTCGDYSFSVAESLAEGEGSGLKARDARRRRSGREP
jgi:hypothetical protein